MAKEVIQGEDKKLVIKLRDSAGDPWDLTPYTTGLPNDIVFCIGRADDTMFQLKLSTAGITVTSAILGRLELTIPDTETLLLELGALGFELELIKSAGADKNIIQFPEALNVIERVC